MRVVNVRDYGGIEPATRAGVRYVGRPSPLGNPFTHLPGVKGTTRVGSVREAVARYRGWLWGRVRTRDGNLLGALGVLNEGDVLGCWCVTADELPPPDEEVCHAQVVIRAWRWCKNHGLFSPVK